VRADGSLVVRAPHSASESAIQKFILKNREWIDRASRAARERMALVRPKRFEEGEKFLYLGHEHTLHVAQDMFGKLIFEDRFILSARYQPKARRLFERWYKERAFSVFTERCRLYAAQMGTSYKSLSLSSAKTRWGCCTPRGTLRFNWRLVMAPVEVIDYVMVHELAHLKELNHSRRFWEIVSKALPDHSHAKKWLKENGLRLHFPVE
jgi:predicted metal-dependent hydrolase